MYVCHSYHSIRWNSIKFISTTHCCSGRGTAHFVVIMVVNTSDTHTVVFVQLHPFDNIASEFGCSTGCSELTMVHVVGNYTLAPKAYLLNPASFDIHWCYHLIITL